MMFARALSLSMLLALATGCGGSGDPADALDAESVAQAEALRRDYESARQEANWEVAEAHADALRTRFPDAPAAEAIAPSLPEVRRQAEAAREARRLRDLWTYQTTPVEGGVQRTATIYSRTPPAGEDLPAVEPDAQLVLRDHASWGRSAYLLLAQKDFSCPAPCRIEIAFDDGEARRFEGRAADSGKGPALFIEDEAAFEEALAKARELRIRLPEGSGRLRSLAFDVGGFAPARYARP
jgi:hypothetical protein